MHNETNIGWLFDGGANMPTGMTPAQFDAKYPDLAPPPAPPDPYASYVAALKADIAAFHAIPNPTFPTVNAWEMAADILFHALQDIVHLLPPTVMVTTSDVLATYMAVCKGELYNVPEETDHPLTYGQLVMAAKKHYESVILARTAITKQEVDSEMVVFLDTALPTDPAILAAMLNEGGLIPALLDGAEAWPPVILAQDVLRQAIRDILSTYNPFAG